MDRRQVDLSSAVGHLSLRQSVAHEHGLDRLHVIFGGEVHHRQIFVIELAVLLGRILIARDEMVEHVEMSGDVAIDVHRHEAAELKKPRIDLAAEAGIGERDRMQAVAAEPFDAALLGQLVDLGRAAAGVHRAAHEGHARGRGAVAVGLHQRRRREQRHRRLADPDRVHARAQMSQHLAQVDDVVVEVEGPERQGNHARIGPVGDVDVVMGQERLDRAAKQRCVMARHGRDDQKLWLTRAVGKIRPGEMKEVAERPAPNDLLEDRIDGAVDAESRRGERPASHTGGSCVRTFRCWRRCSCQMACWRADSRDC